ncbi:hypothetical protein [Streptomyces cavernae]|uniref:hypothetical protein n=1 Tax=Streptomyces cavernae TaxID=2259034 RepID=UPI000FEB8564|nr:hypothetical protein [Streptomyces cavernae]
MWPGNQPPGGEQNPQHQDNPYQQPGYQQPNPYQQPGYQQQNPYGQQQGQPGWGTPTMPLGATPPPGPPHDDSKRTKIVAVVAALAVVVTAVVTGVLVLGGGEDDAADGGSSDKAKESPTVEQQPSASVSSGNPREADDGKPLIAGWKTVVNPKWGTAFDVPSDWTIESPGTFIGFEDAQKGDGSAIVGMSAPAFYKDKWCTSDDNKDGNTEDTALAAAGTKGQNGAKSTDAAARSDSATWAWAGYTEQTKADEKKIVIGKPAAYKSKGGVEGSVASSYTTGVVKKDKCDSDGKATTFAFKNSAGDFVSWTFYGAKGVSGEVPESMIKQIMSTVRLHGEPTGP